MSIIHRDGTVVSQGSFNHAMCRIDDLERFEKVAKRLKRLIDHYERMSGLFETDDIRGPMMAQAAKDMREVIESQAKHTKENQ